MKPARTHYTVGKTVYRIVGFTVVIEHPGGMVELYRRCTSKEDATAKLELIVIKAASEAVFHPSNDFIFNQG